MNSRPSLLTLLEISNRIAEGKIRAKKDSKLLTLFDFKNRIKNPQQLQFSLPDIIISTFYFGKKLKMDRDRLMYQTFLSLNEIFDDFNIETTKFQVKNNKLFCPKFDAKLELLIFTGFFDVKNNSLSLTHNGKKRIETKKSEFPEFPTAKIIEKLETWNNLDLDLLRESIFERYFDMKSAEWANKITYQVLPSFKQISNRNDSVFPSIRKPLRKKPLNLIGKVTPFINRKEEIKKISSVVKRRPQFISLRGSPGVGKTQLSYRVLENIQGNFNYIGLIYLKNTTNYFDFCKELYDVLEIPNFLRDSKGIPSKIPTIISDQIQKYKPLIFCDNFELIENKDISDYEKITNLLNSLPLGFTFLFNSRETIPYFENESTMRIHVLREDNFSIFKGIAKQGNSNAQIVSQDLDTVRTIENTGSPLAISLLAKNFRTFQEIKNLQFSLSGQDLDKISLEQLNSCIEFSINKLDHPSKKLMLRKLTTFKNCFPQYVACKFLDVEPYVIHSLSKSGFLTRLDDLEDHSADQKFWLYDFHPEIKKYLIEHVPLDNSNNYDLEKAKCYLDFLKEIKSRMLEGKSFSPRRFEILLEKNNDLVYAFNKLPKEEASTYFDLLGITSRIIGLSDKAIFYHKKSMDIDKKLNNTYNQIRNYCHIGPSFANLGRFNLALQYLTKAISLGQKQLDSKNIQSNPEEYKKIQELVSKAYRYKGLTYRNMGKHQKAIRHLKKSIKLNNDVRHLGKCYRGLGTVYRNVGNYHTAIFYLKKSYTIATEHQDEVNVVVNKRNLGITFRLMGKHRDALDLLRDCAKLDQEKSNKKGLARDKLNIGMALSGLGYHHEALEELQEAITIDEQLNIEDNMARDYIYLGIVYRNFGLIDNALTFLVKGLNLHNKLQNDFGVAFARHYLGVVLRDIGLYKKALEQFEISVEINKRMRNNLLLSSDYRNISILHRDLGERAILLDEIENNPYFSELSTDLKKDFKELRKQSTNSHNHFKNSFKYLEYACDVEIIQDNVMQKLKENYSQGVTYNYAGDHHKSVFYLKKALILANQLQNDIGIIRIYRHLGSSYRKMHDYSNALKFLSLSKTKIKNLKNPIQEAKILNELALLFKETEQYDKALEHIKESRKLNNIIQHHYDHILNFYQLSDIFRLKNDISQAKDHYVKSVELLCYIENSNTTEIENYLDLTQLPRLSKIYN